MSGVPRIPGALEMTCASPCGKTITSPSESRTGSSPAMPPQHVPFVTTWYSIRCCTPGMTADAISCAAGAAATHGGEASMVK
jgi:hypothetical protein